MIIAPLSKTLFHDQTLDGLYTMQFRARGAEKASQTSDVWLKRLVRQGRSAKKYALLLLLLLLASPPWLNVLARLALGAIPGRISKRKSRNLWS